MKTQGAQKSLNPIYRLRKKHGWTRQKLADRANINPITIRRIELGSHAKKCTYKKIAIALGVSMNEVANHES